jgi:hypothetical protein
MRINGIAVPGFLLLVLLVLLVFWLFSRR